MWSSLRLGVKMMKTAKEMFEELGYEYTNDDGFTEYLKGTPSPNKLITEEVKFKKISFDRWGQKMSVHEYRITADCVKLLPNATNMCLNILDVYELRAIHQQLKELGWLDE